MWLRTIVFIAIFGMAWHYLYPVQALSPYQTGSLFRTLNNLNYRDAGRRIFSRRS